MNQPRIDVALEEDETAAGGRRTLTMNFGPQHPATHGTLRMVLELDGEVVVRATPEIGYLHTGFEKLGEFRNFNQFVTLSDRMNYMSPLCNNIGYTQAVEELLGLEITPRCRVLRVILAELTRIADHVVCTGLQAMDLGAFTVFLWAFIERERLYDLFEQVTGTRLTTSYTRVGGLMRDVPADFPERVRAFLDKLPVVLDEMEKMLARNRIFVDRTRGIGVLPPDVALAYGVSGPVLRASGVAYDVRRARPYLGYHEYDFDLVTSNDGDCYARFLVRMGEMRESLKIIRQALERLPEGPINIFNHKITLPEKQLVYTKMESLIHHFKLIMDGHGLKPERGRELYSCTESPNGELGYHLVSDGTDRPYRIRVRPPSLLNYQPVARMVEGRLLSDVVAVLSSLNVIAGELDR
jgi:NADH dehydrogenase I D subunit